MDMDRGRPSKRVLRASAHHRLLASICLALPLALTACGTTVHLTGAAVGSQSGLDLGTGVGQRQTGTNSAASGTSIPGSVWSKATAAASGSAGGGALPGSGSPSTPTTAISVPKARGVTATTITIGIAVATGTDALASSLGISGAGSVPTQDVIKAVVADVNKSGGVLGRKLAVVVHTFDAAKGIANPEQTIAEICADYRDDHKVFAVMFDVTLPSLRKCLADMGSPLVVLNGYTIMPASAYTDHGGNFMYGPDSITTDRLAELFIQSLMARSFTEKWNTTAGGPGALPVKLGVIHVDAPDQNALYAGYATELGKRGLKFADTVTYSQNADAALAATQNAVLKFRADGITHVFGASAFFLRAAESQGYRPRYAYLPGLGTIGTDNSPAAQMKGALTVGWSPMSDVPNAQYPGDTTAAKHCRAVMKGANLSTSNRTDIQTMFAICDAVYSVRDALTAGQVASVSGLRQGFEAMGTRFGTALTFAALLAPNHHYGVDSVRDMAWDSQCSCLKYTSTTNRS